MAPKRSLHREAGIALIVAILALMLLTFLGLTLAATTSSELQISTNYRLAEQALYNSEAGIELAKAYLRDATWSNILPPVRKAAGVPAEWQIGGPWPALQAPAAGSTRSCENGYPGCDWAQAAGCDNRNGQQGYGWIFNDGSIVGENLSTFSGFTLNGTFTIWVRRTLYVQSLTYSDYNGEYNSFPPSDLDPRYGHDADDIMIVTSEGSAGTGENRAVRLLEVTVTRTVNTVGGFCSTRSGQSGGGPGGAGFGSCLPIGDSILGGAEINKGAK